MDTGDPLRDVMQRLGAYQAAPVREFSCAGYTFQLDDGVFPPTQFQSTGIFTQALEFHAGRSFLELGCGAGVTAIVAAFRGAQPVVACDISHAAVSNAQANVVRHGLGALVSVRQGDLFDVLEEGERFDTIFWNSNFLFVSDDYRHVSPMLKAFCDPGYASHSRFLREAPNHLTQDGRLLLGFSSQGRDDALKQLLREHGYSCEVLHSEFGQGPQAHRYDIFQLKPRAR